MVALLRAVNVGGTAKLPMADLKAMCVAVGLNDVQTYIASGNVVFASVKSKEEVRAGLEARLLVHMGKPVGVHLRTVHELENLIADNPFPDAPGNRCVIIFLDAPPPVDALNYVTGQGAEKLALGKREIYVWYDEGMGRSKLKIPAAKLGTARNVNTVRKLVEIARG
jgi:uncharacterized protein (DUF1697 family)